MTCADNRSLHSALLDGELAPAERAQVEAHLATCAECTAELSALARTLGMLHALPAPRAPLGFVDRVLEAARPLPWYRRWGRRLFQPLRVKLPLEAAAVMLVALGAVYVFQHTPELQQAARQEQPAPSPVPSPVPVSPPATPAPATSSTEPVTPAPTPGALEETQPRFGEVDRTDKKERGPALKDAPSPAPATTPRSEPRANAQKLTKATKPQARSDSAEAPSGAVSLKKDAAAGSPPVAAPAPASAPAPVLAPPPIATAPPAAAPPTGAPTTDAKPATPAPEAREKSAARDRSQTPRETQAPRGTEGARPESKSGDLSARAQQMPARLFVAPDTAGRLVVSDRIAADRALADLGGRLGVAQAFRREEPDGALIEWIVPREVYAEFVRGLAGIGRWTADREPSALPARVRLQVRVGG
jgi:Putative zinc-finger